MWPMIMMPLMMGMGGMDGTAESSTGLEFRYQPGLVARANQNLTTFEPGGSPTLVVGLDTRRSMGLVGVGGQIGVAIQTSQGQGTGNWVTPHAGIMPRVGIGLGPLRVDAGVLLGAGAMIRQVGLTGGGTGLESRLTWLAEPRIDLGMQAGGIGLGLVAGYMVSPFGDLGGPSAGFRVAFGGSSAGTKESQPASPSPGNDSHRGHHMPMH